MWTLWTHAKNKLPSTTRTCTAARSASSTASSRLKGQNYPAGSGSRSPGTAALPAAQKYDLRHGAQTEHRSVVGGKHMSACISITRLKTDACTRCKGVAALFVRKIDIFERDRLDILKWRLTDSWCPILNVPLPCETPLREKECFR